MPTFLIILIGLILLAGTVIVELKIVLWIADKGGLKSRTKRFFIAYLPVALWAVSFYTPFLYSIFTMSSFPEDLKPYFTAISMLLGIFYGIAFFLHYLTSGSPVYEYRDASMFSMGLSVVMILGVGASSYDCLRVNTTPSMPRGVYTLSPVEENPLRGDLVTLCLESDNAFTAIAEERGYISEGSCSTGLAPLLKVLAGTSGDMVEASPDGIILNGSFLAGTARPELDSKGREVPPSLLKNGQIPTGQALVISQEHSGSFDSRHFGLVPYDSLQKVSPLLIYKENAKNE